MELNSLWFALISVLFIGYFLLEGFDFGVGILLPFLGKDDTDRRVMINTFGPHWDGNEVWLLVAGGATFAAFPHWYATLFSGFYLALLLILVGLIVRAVAIEYRSKDRHPTWRMVWDWMIFLGSLLPALLWGVAFANIVRGVPIDASKTYVGGFWNLLNWYALLGGAVTLSAFALHGALFLGLKSKGEMQARAQRASARIWPVAVVVAVAFLVTTYFETDLLTSGHVLPWILAAAGAAALLAAGWFVRGRRGGWAFVGTGLTIALVVSTLFAGLYPRVMISSLSPDWSLTIANSSSSPYTLRVMTIVAAILVPIVLLYQGWTFWIFRKRIGREDSLEY